MASLELRQRLRVGIEVTKGEPLQALDERASLLPALGERNEVPRGGELDVDLQLVLEAGNRSQDGVLFGNELQVDVDRRRPPAGEDGGRSADQVADAVLLGGGIQGREQTLDPLLVG